VTLSNPFMPRASFEEIRLVSKSMKWCGGHQESNIACFFRTKHLERLDQVDILDGAANSVNSDLGG